MTLDTNCESSEAASQANCYNVGEPGAECTISDPLNYPSVQAYIVTVLKRCQRHVTWELIPLTCSLLSFILALLVFPDFKSFNYMFPVFVLFYFF